LKNTLITVCARGGSKGIPEKNIKHINGKPLIYYTLRLAREFQKKYANSYVYLSTDSEKIREVVQDLAFDGLNTSYSRPPKLASDSAGKMDVIIDVKKHAESENNLKFDFVMDLDVTSPLRTLQDLEIAFQNLEKKEEAFNIFSVSPATRNPYFNMVELDDHGFAKLCKKGNFLTRQSAPRVYDMNASFYIFKKKFFEEAEISLMQRALIYDVPHLCFDLDEPIDFEFMEYLINNEKLDFKLLS